MHTYNPNIHNRRSIRLKGYDYSQAGLYFITICCQDRAHLFGNIENGEMKLNAFGKIAWEEWLATEKIRKNCKIHQSIVMPNHIHGIIEILYKKEKSPESESQFASATPSDIGKFKSPSQTIGAIIRGFKIATIKKIKEEINKRESDSSTRELEKGKSNSSTGELPLLLFVLLFSCSFGLVLGSLAVLYDNLIESQYKRKRDNLKLFVLPFVEPFVYHPLLLYFSLLGFVRYLKLKEVNWGTMSRKGYKESAEVIVTQN